MMMTTEGQAVLTRGDWTPAKLSLGSEVIATPIAMTATGEGGVTIPNTYNDSCKLVQITGACEQDVSTQGDNLFTAVGVDINTSQATFENIGENEVVVTNAQTVADGTSRLSLVGVAIPSVVAGNTYTLSLKREIVSTSHEALTQIARIYVVGGAGTIAQTGTMTDGTNIASFVAPELSDGESLRLYLYSQSSTTTYTVDAVVRFYDIQLEIGSTATDYEPFVPDSPTPDYPSEIRCVGGSVTSMGRNLVDVADRTVTAGLARNALSDDLMGKTITASCSAELIYGNSCNLRIDYVVGGTTTYKASDTISSVGEAQLQVTQTIPTEATIAYLTLQTNASSQAGFSDIQLELGSTATDYQPYYEPVTIDLPDLYAVGDMADVMWIDQGQQRAWVERHIDSDILSTSAVVDEQSQAVLTTPTIEELEYTALPTYPRYTQLVVSDSDVAPAIEATALVYREEES